MIHLLAFCILLQLCHLLQLIEPPLPYRPCCCAASSLLLHFLLCLIVSHHLRDRRHSRSSEKNSPEFHHADSNSSKRSKFGTAERFISCKQKNDHPKHFCKLRSCSKQDGRYQHQSKISRIHLQLLFKCSAAGVIRRVLCERCVSSRFFRFSIGCS